MTRAFLFNGTTWRWPRNPHQIRDSKQHRRSEEPLPVNSGTRVVKTTKANEETLK
jgi:hypothetical protein